MVVSPGEAALSAEIEELLQFIYLAPVAIVKFGQQGTVEMINPKAVQLLEVLGIDVGLSDGPAIMDGLSPGLAAAWQASATQLGAVCAPRHVRLEGAGGDLYAVVTLVRADARCTMLAIEDVTATVRQERELVQHKQRFGAVLENIEGCCVVMLDALGNIVDWNPSIGRMFGPARVSLVGQSVDRLLLSGAPQERVEITFELARQAIAQQGAFRREVALRAGAGALIRGDVVATPTVEGSGSVSGYVYVIRDITDQYAAQQRLLTDAMTDPLTGLLNRRGLDRMLRVLSDAGPEGGRRAGWIMADIDHFKRVNDSYGHAAGDEVLKAVAGLLKASTRDGDLIARLGGEEFLVVLPGAALAAASRSAERMRERIAGSPMLSGGGSFRITSSFGVVESPIDSRWHLAISAADEALYRAKTQGRNRVVVGQITPPD